MADATAALSVRSKVQAFFEAARAGDLDALKKLVAALDEEGKGAPAVAAAVRDANKRTALHFAAREGRTEVCDFLIDQLALPVDPTDDDGETPLIHATRQGHLQTAKYLLDHGANPSVATSLGATALHRAVGIGNIELMKMFLSKGVIMSNQKATLVLPSYGLLAMDNKMQSSFCFNTMLSQILKLMMVSRHCCLLWLLVPSHAWKF